MSNAALNAMLFFPGKGLVSIDGVVGEFAGVHRLDNSGKRFLVDLRVAATPAEHRRGNVLTHIEQKEVITTG